MSLTLICHLEVEVEDAALVGAARGTRDGRLPVVLGRVERLSTDA